MNPDDGRVGIAERKRALRREARARRAGLTVGARAAASRDASWHVLRHLPCRDRPKVALSWPLPDELDTRPLLHALHWLGAEPLLPRMQGRGRPLVFHRWTPEMPLVEGPMGVLEPAPDLPAALPEIVLAPLLAFDRRGRRLGYGAGFYDMTFSAIAAAGGAPVRAGLAFACQEVDVVPADGTDVALELVVTEAGCLPVEGPPPFP